MSLSTCPECSGDLMRPESMPGKPAAAHKRACTACGWTEAK